MNYEAFSYKFSIKKHSFLFFDFAKSTLQNRQIKEKLKPQFTLWQHFYKNEINKKGKESFLHT